MRTVVRSVRLRPNNRVYIGIYDFYVLPYVSCNLAINTSDCKEVEIPETQCDPIMKEI